MNIQLFVWFFTKEHLQGSNSMYRDDLGIMGDVTVVANSPFLVRNLRLIVAGAPCVYKVSYKACALFERLL